MLTEEQKLKIKEEEEYKAQVREELKPKKRHGCLIAFVLIFIVAPIFFSVVFGFKNGSTPKVLPTPFPSIKPGTGIHVTRALLVKSYGNFGFVFKKSDPIYGLENYIAEKDGFTLQLLGPEANLSEVDGVAMLNSTDTAANLTRISRLLALSNIVGYDCVVWVKETIASNSTDTPWEKTANVCGRSLSLVAIPAYSLSLGIRPAN